MDDTFRIYVDQLRDGQERKIQEVCAPQFMGIQEKELEFKKPITVAGEAYLASDSLIIRLDATAYALLPCRVCNHWAEVKIQLDDFYIAKPLVEIKGAIYDFSDILREEILLEIPQFAECDNGQCPNRTEIQKYLKKTDDHQDEEEGYRPFAEL